MNIAIDLDGVLFDTELWFMTYANLFNLDLKKGKVKNKYGIRVQDRYNWSEKDVRKYIESCSFQIEEKAPMMPLAKEVLLALEKKNNLFVISSRGLLHDGEEAVTLKRLEKENLHFKKVLFRQHSKVEACKQNNIDIIIDDYPSVVKEISENNIKCFYYKDLALEKIEKENVVEVRNWGEIAVEFMKLGVIDKNDLKFEI